MSLFDVAIPITTETDGSASVLSAPFNGYVTTVSMDMGTLDSGGAMDLFVTNEETGEDILTLADMTGNINIHPRAAVQDELGVDIAGQFVPYFVDGTVRIEIVSGGSERSGEVILSVDGSGAALIDAFATRTLTNPAAWAYVDVSKPPYLSDGGGRATGNPLASWPAQEPIFRARSARIAVSDQPNGIDAGDILSPVIVHILDAGGQVNPVNQAITVSLKQVGPTLSGTVSVNTDEGIAIFGDLSVDQSGIYNLVFATAGLVSVESASFVCAPAGLNIASMSDGIIGTPFAVPVDLVDANGDTFTSDDTSSVSITLTEAGSATLSGTKTLTASSGAVEFDLSIDEPGTYTLTVTCADVSAETEEFDIAIS